MSDFTDIPLRRPIDDREWKRIAQAKDRKARLVFTNGCFDLLHIGHTRFLSEARSLGDFLIIGLNSDSSVRRLKGSERPVVPENERQEVLTALRSVDSVCIFDEDTPEALIHRIRPDILVKGGDWQPDQIVGAQFVQSYGGTVRSLSYIAGHSTSEIIHRIERRGC